MRLRFVIGVVVGAVAVLGLGALLTHLVAGTDGGTVCGPRIDSTGVRGRPMV